MNILLLVTALLMMLSILTYARLDNFRNYSGMQAEFERYMQHLERAYPNQIAKQWYDTTIANSNDGGPKDRADTDASPRLSFLVLIDADVRGKNEKAYQQNMQWAKKLIYNLYSKQPFLKEELDKNDRFIENLLEDLSRVVSGLPKKKRPKQTDDLANLRLDPEYETVFYSMLKGCLSADDPSSQTNPAGRVEPIVENGKNDDEKDNAEEALQSSSTKAYTSLLNYITLMDKKKIRVFLASRELLLAIFESPAIVDQMIRERYSFYRLVKNGGLTAKEAGEQFKAAFQSSIPAESEQFLNFQVTKTNPLDYD